MALPTRSLGPLTVSAQGLGCMSMTDFAYGPADADEATATLHRALDLGVTFIDTADIYGLTENERLVGRALAGRRDEVVLATKFANRDRRGRARTSTAARSGVARRATHRSNGSVWTTSTSTTSTGPTRACRSRSRSARCRS